jgi:hypothetical protein
VDAEPQGLHRIRALNAGGTLEQHPGGPSDLATPIVWCGFGASLLLVLLPILDGRRRYLPRDRVLAMAIRADIAPMNRPHRLRVHLLAPPLGQLVPHKDPLTLPNTVPAPPIGTTPFSISAI